MEEADGVRDLLLLWDPIGVRPLTEPAVWDEYDCMIGPLLSLLGRGAAAGEINAYLQEELVEHFGLGDQPQGRMTFTERVLDWWPRRDVSTLDLWSDWPEARAAARWMQTLDPGCSVATATVPFTGDRLLHAVARYLQGARDDDLPMIAVEALAAGRDSMAVSVLAGLRRGDAPEIRDAVDAIRGEIGWADDRVDPIRFLVQAYLTCITRAVIPAFVGALVVAHMDDEDLAAVGIDRLAYMGLASQWEDDPDHRALLDADIVQQADADLLVLLGAQQ